MSIKTTYSLKKLGFLIFILFSLSAAPLFAADVMINGTFDSDISNWTESVVRNQGTRAWDNTVYGASSGSMRYRTLSGSRQEYRLTDRGTTTATINATDQVFLSFYWYKTATDLGTDRHELAVSIVLPSGTAVQVWSDLQEPSGGQVIDGNVTNLDISSQCTENGLYQIELSTRIATIRNSTGYVQANFDDIILDAQGAANNAPTVVSDVTVASPIDVNRFGTNTTTISTDFADSDQPDVGAFNVTFKVREPDNSTEVILVNNLPNGSGGLTITDGGGGNYTASFDWDPGATQALGLYDLYFEVTDGTDNVIDGYTPNDNELTVSETIPNNAPTVVSDATTVSPADVNRAGSYTTTISTDFADIDQPGVGAFNVTFKVREPGDVTEVILVNNLSNGSGGLTITDGGGGNYTASYDWDPGAAQALGLYDLYFEVTDGTDNVIDGYTPNADELTVSEPPPNNAPSVAIGATQTSPLSVNRYSTNTTVISTVFDDSDEPGVGAFTCTFKIKDISETEYTLVNNQTNGGGGLTIIDNGGGSYTASYTYNPDDAQTIGDYDLYFEVSDGIDNAVDAYVDNNNELNIYQQIPPSIVSDATIVSKTPVGRQGSDNTTVICDFTDLDQPAVGTFTVIFKVREPDNSTELVLVNNLPHGSGGLTITDNGGGSYTAQYTWDPAANQTLGLYDLYFEVNDGTDIATDGFVINSDELDVQTSVGNSAPTVISDATTVSPATVNRVGTNTTTISTAFSDADVPGVGGFTCTFKIKDISEVEYTLVNNLSNGSGGLTITDQGGGNYTASYTWDPGAAQTLGTYDLYFEVSDGTDNVIDDYTPNADELTVEEVVANNAPTIVSDATIASPTTVNRVGANTTTISTSFYDADVPGVGAFTCTFKVKDIGEAEYTLVNNLPNGSGGLAITDQGGGDYIASYTWDPGPTQALGTYDLYFEVSDGIDNGIDGYVPNADELTITDVVANNPPLVTTGATYTDKAQVNRFGTDNVTLYCIFDDADEPGIGAFTATFKIREPDNLTELILVNNQPNGSGGLTITDNGGGEYLASYIYDPTISQNLGMYDLYFEVSDGTDNAIDDYVNNQNDLQIIESILNNPPSLAAGIMSTTPGSVNRFGANPVIFSAIFNDIDEPGTAAFYVIFKARPPFGGSHVLISDSLQNGQGGLSITDNGGGSYTATISWDPNSNATLGYYDLYCMVTDGTDAGEDDFVNNLDELLISNGGENSPPVVPADNVFASPAGVERIGVNASTISATFTDADSPGVGGFKVSFKLREPNNVTEIILANNLTDGIGGVTISDDGGGLYTASIGWDPADAQTLGFYDIYFHVTDNIDTSYDAYVNNFDELEIYDAISNNPPTLTGGTASVLPNSVNRIGSDFTMISASFTDDDMPGIGAFTVTIKVRDNTLTETTIVNLAKHSEQDLRIRHTTGINYEASVLWDPPVSQTIDDYDLYFYVEDNVSASVTDDYANNSDELSVISEALTGDGNLLRRSHNAAGCGDSTNGCHLIIGHQSQDCLVCHEPHGTKNIYLVRDTIQTPNSGDKEVIFKTLGIGDPYNDPDPVAGDPTSGVMADSTDGVFTGVCEVCHTTAGHHRNDGSQPPPNHNDATDCTGCHPHEEGFAVSGGGESSGGSSCGTCHSSIMSGMDSTATDFRHVMTNDDADYSPGISNTFTIKNCLTCHVDHDIFRPDLNTGFGLRSKNLRASFDIDPVSGDNTVLSNSDYSSTGSGGICLSCHSGPSCLGCHSSHKSGSWAHTFVPKADYDAATSSHNYDVQSTFSTGGSTFNANCTKCHNDNKTRQYQNSTYKFSLHSSHTEKLLDTTGIVGATNPLEEEFCFKCHSTTSNPNSGSGLDFYGIKSMTTVSQSIETAFGRSFTHPTATYSGRHSMEDSALSLGDGNRHAECEDCHDPHAAQQGTHDGTSNLVSNALKGTWGVEVTSWDNPPTTPTDNGNVFDTPSGFTKEDPATKEYQICLKCHSNYVTLPSGSRNLAEEINPYYPSMHAIVQAGDNAFCNSTTMNEPWATNKINYCSDCHRSDTPTDPEGPHGSNADNLLVDTYVSNSTNGTPLCYVCHKASVYWTGSGSPSDYDDHPGTQGQHKLAPGCFSCHMWDHSSTAGLGLPTDDWPGTFDNTASLPPPIKIWIHGQNRRWVYNEQDGSAGSGQPVENFVNGYIANMDHGANRCWTETCKVHSNKAY